MLHNNIIPFSDKTFENLIFIPVILNNKTVIALFDTGAGMSFITESTVKQLGDLQMMSSITVGNNQEKVSSYETTVIDHIQIGDRVLLAQEVGILPDTALEFGEDCYHNQFPASMLLGWDMIAQFGWAFEMKQKTVKIYPGGTMPQSNSLSWNDYPIININYAGANFSVGFDSGHTETFLDYTWAFRLQDLKSSETITQGIGSKLTEQVKLAEKLSFSIGATPITLHHVEVVEHPIYGSAKDSISGLLGADILSDANWILDYKSQCFEITK